MLCLLREYLESANGCNARFLRILLEEGHGRDALSSLIELNAIEPQVDLVTNSKDLFHIMLALIKDWGLSSYSQAALNEACNIHKEQQDAEKTTAFMLRQPEDEQARGEQKVFAVGLLKNLSLQNLFPYLTHKDRDVHQKSLLGIRHDSKDDSGVDLYGKNDALPINEWIPSKLTVEQANAYEQMLSMTETAL